MVDTFANVIQAKNFDVKCQKTNENGENLTAQSFWFKANQTSGRLKEMSRPARRKSRLGRQICRSVKGKLIPIHVSKRLNQSLSNVIFESISSHSHHISNPFQFISPLDPSPNWLAPFFVLI